MAKRKAKRRGTEDIEEKSQAGNSTGVSENFTSRSLPLFVIGAALIILIVVVISLSSTSKSNNQNSQLAAPAAAVDKFVVGQAIIPKATLSTFKLVELSSPDCVYTIVNEFKKLDGIATVRADYANKLLEVKYDPQKVTTDHMVEALKKANHPGQLTNEFIGTN